jgi:hypothetical protein
MDKMFKYKMTNTNKCKRCGEIETNKHLVWECKESRGIWKEYNEFLNLEKHPDEVISIYDDFFKIGNISNLSKIKMKIIQGMIQIERPVNWTKESIMKIAKEIKDIELYNSRQINK